MTDIETGNLFAAIPSGGAAEEIFTALLARPGVKIERIVSNGHASPPGFWYDQQQHEWVLLLQGSAQLRFADEPQARTLGPGDYLFIEAHKRHRVDATSAAGPTVWLAMHFEASNS